MITQSLTDLSCYVRLGITHIVDLITLMAQNHNNFIHNLILLLDFVITNAVVSIYYFYNKDAVPVGTDSVNLPILLLMANGSLIVAQYFFSNVVHAHYKAIDKVLRQVCLLSFIFAVIFLCATASSEYFFDTVFPDIDFTLRCIGYTVIALVVSRIAEYAAVRELRIFGRNSRSLLFVGDSKLIAQVYNDINIQSHAGLRVIGYYSNNPIKENPRLKMKQLGTLKDLRRLIEEDAPRLSDDIYCTDIPNSKLITQLVDYSMRKGIQFNFVPPTLTDFGYCLKPRSEGELVVFSNLNEPLMSLGNRLMKRAFDIVVSSIGMIVLIPIIPIVGIGIKLSSPGPIFFKQKRTGLNGEEFNMIKFRSMHVNSEADSKQATANDPRKFAFGSFMRKTSIDELPQFINVFRGDMSIVGPRPHMVAHTEEYRKKIYEYMLRHLVRPGITGWAQVTGFRGETPELWQMEGRVQRDIWYIQNWSFWLDIRIIFRTVLLTIFHDKNAQ